MTTPPILSPHLTEPEFLATSYRAFWEEQVAAWPGVRSNAQQFAAQVFERVREIVGPLRVTSGFRCGALNSCVGGRPTSRHVLGLAADVVPVTMTVDDAMHRIASALDAGALQDVDEAIREMGWIHLQAASAGSAPRRLALATSDGVRFEPFVRLHA